MDALEALRLAREVRPEVPFVFLSGAIGEETAIEMLKLGQATTCSSSESSVSFPLCVEPCGRPRNTCARKQAEAALRESEERFRALMTATSEVVYRMSPDWSEMRGLMAGSSSPTRKSPAATGFSSTSTRTINRA